MAAALRACLAIGITVLASFSFCSRSAHASDPLDAAPSDSMAAALGDSILRAYAARADTLGMGARLARIGSGFGRLSSSGIRSGFPGGPHPDSSRRAKPPSLAAMIGMMVFVEGFTFGISSLGYGGDGAQTLAGLDGLAALGSLLTPNPYANNPTVTTILNCAAYLGLGAYMIQLDEDEAPKGRVVLHHFLGLNAAAFTVAGIDALFKPRRPKAEPVAELTDPNRPTLAPADSSGVRRE